MKPPKTIKQLKSFIGRVSYIRSFQPWLSSSNIPEALEKDVSIRWDKEQQTAFQKVKRVLSSPHLSKSIHRVEVNYPPIECYCLALLISTQLRHFS